MIYSLGFAVIDWIEDNLVHGPGDIAGEPIHLDDEFAAFIVKAYQLRPDGRRRYRRAFLSRAKGRAKSELAAMIACAEALGPVRFAGEDRHGEPLGEPPTSPEILCVATEEDQAGNVYEHVRFMLRNGQASHRYSVRAGLERTVVPGGVIEPITTGADSKDGGRSTFVIFDETHLYVTPRLRRLHATIRRNLGKRKLAEPWSLETSTMYRPGEESVAELTHRYARAVNGGEVEDDSLLFDHRAGPMRFNWRSDRELRHALEEAYGAAAPWMDLDRIVQECRDPQADEADSRRFWLNQVVPTANQWVAVAEWDALTNPQVVDPREPITLGFDGSRFDDATALVACRISDGYLFVPRQSDGEPAVWEKPLGEPDWEVPRRAVDAVVASMFDRYDVRRMYCDPHDWEDTIDRWASEFGEKRVIAWWTNRYTQMARAVKRLKDSIRAREVQHDGTPVLGRHVGNAHREPTRDGEVIRKESKMSARKIDAAMAAILAYEARGDCLGSGDGRRRRSAYEDHGLVTA